MRSSIPLDYRMFEMMIDLLDRLEEVDPKYYGSDMIAQADDLLKEYEDNLHPSIALKA